MDSFRTPLGCSLEPRLSHNSKDYVLGYQDPCKQHALSKWISEYQYAEGGTLMLQATFHASLQLYTSRDS